VSLVDFSSTSLDESSPLLAEPDSDPESDPEPEADPDALASLLSSSGDGSFTGSAFFLVLLLTLGI